MTYFSFSKRFQGVADVFLRSPERYRPLLAFLEDIMVSPSALTKTEREIIAARVSQLNGCEFCVQAHVATLRALQVEESLLNVVLAGPSGRFDEPRLQSLVSFAKKLTLSPHTVQQADIDQLITAGCSEQVIEDAINVIALFNYVNRLVDGFGVQGSPRYFDNVGRALAANGYANLLPAAGSQQQARAHE